MKPVMKKYNLDLDIECTDEMFVLIMYSMAGSLKAMEENKSSPDIVRLSGNIHSIDDNHIIGIDRFFEKVKEMKEGDPQKEKLNALLKKNKDRTNRS